ncbi:MAG: TonB-dependent receptor [Vicinamibacterales bacterium]|mgnify:CR=1 FL=1|jgi:outer membrane receptor protein involved in Fe transport|nr:hypothetical protein [Acidobacteriota bacterium]MDP7293882.1 TonB-dependent receptor [Vicinamibacterales bacterium]MDP7471096.1 TonB-dependent receptor [Vicinamibacterales bacterium]MDP7670702.1 TonB-dependent receptor [Vicinamibacterales bacterium]HJO39015.1 TonB-dependent receptor [Vicinamibacterales bacterium]
MSFVQVVALWATTTSLGLAPQPTNRTLSGSIEDLLGGIVPAASVTVICGDRVVRAVADDQGRFEIADLPARSCFVVAERELFTAASADVDLSDRSVTDLLITLSVAGPETEVVVTPARGAAEQAFDVPEAVTVTTREEIESRPNQILPQVLREEPGVLVQQTTTAQGSPFIRGFSAQRIVYLMDGVRFNTSTFRAGATQYLGWINPALVDRMEVVRGPSSVQYGSDALGGTINVLSVQPPRAPTGRQVSGVVEAGFGSADLSGSGDATVLVQDRAWAVRFGGSTQRVGELRTGRGRDSHSALTRFLGLPSETLYESLPDTGFSQSGAYVAATVDAGDGATLDAVYLHEDQFGVSRYDRLLGGNGRHRSEFEPQRLDFGYARYQRGRTGWLDGLSTTISLNRQQDDRVEQSRPDTSIDRQDGRVLAIGYQAQGTRLVGGRHALTFGGEVYDEYIAAGRTLEDPGSSLPTAVRPRIPDGTRYTSTGLFVQTASELVPGRLTLRAGLRHGYFLFRTQADPDLDVGAERIPSSALTFHTGAVVGVTNAVNATFTVSRGFRAANAFDLGSIGISGGGFEVTPQAAGDLGGLIGDNDGADAVSTGVPVDELGPESGIVIEGGIKVRTPRTSASLTLFDLEMRDIIQRRTAIFPTPIVGTTIAGFTVVRQDASGRAFVDEDTRPIVTRVNVDRARVLGLEGDAQVRVAPDWLVAGYFSLVNGRELDSDLYLRRMPPPLGGARLRWEPAGRRHWVEGIVNFAFAQTRLSPGDLTDARIGGWRTRVSIAEFFNGGATDLGLVADGRLTATGETLEQVQTRILGDAAGTALFEETPAFLAVGARAGWQVHPRLSLTLIAENLTDRNYRWHGSGVDGPGLHLQIRTRYNF